MMLFDTTQTLGGVAPFSFDPVPNYWVGDVAYFTGLCPYEFNYSITDASGCVQNTGVPIGNQDEITGQLDATTPGCNGAANGSATFSIGFFGPPPGLGGSVFFNIMSGGVPVQTIEVLLLSEEYAHPTITDLAPGDYTLEGSSTGYCLPATLSLPFTIPDMGPDCGTVQGTVWYDLDHDCVIDGNETRLANRVNTILPGPRYTITNSVGFYSAGLDFGNYTLTQNSAELEQICPTTSPATFTLATGNQLAYIDLGDTSNIGFDLGTDCFLDGARPGFDVNAGLRVRNHSIYPSEVVTLSCVYDAPLEFVSSDVAPTVNTPGYLEWQLPAIGGYSSSAVHPVFTLPPDPALIGTVVSLVATATNAGPEDQTANNTSSFSRTISGPYDPNDKTAATSSGLSDMQYFLDEDSDVTYTIRFQNTGTDTAFTVVLRDTLEVDLDPGTLEVLSSSHPFEPSFEAGRTLVFTFAGIMLPDSGANEAASHGFVRFRIRPRAGLLPGDVISNSAGIYFDLNPPVITEPSVLVAEFSTGLADLGSDHNALIALPNPATDRVRIISQGNISSVQLLDLNGRSVIDQHSTGQRVEMDVYSLPAALYIVEAHMQEGGILRTKLIIGK